MPEIDPSTLHAVDEKLVERYSTRLAKFGDDPRTLGWDKRESQQARFGVAVDSFDFAGRTVLDVGCGLADFHEFLRERGAEPSRYTGCDINPDLLERCRRRQPGCDFHEANLLVDDVPGGPFDVVTLFGVVNFRFSEFSNEDFARGMMRRAFEHCREAVVMDMLTATNDTSYPKEDFVYYYDPADMLKYALSLTPHVSLRHDYRAIPQREMMLVLRRQPWE
jgi:ubiquinone/menaquinone biosynthesis C-methylase UbiE